MTKILVTRSNHTRKKRLCSKILLDTDLKIILLIIKIILLKKLQKILIF